MGETEQVKECPFCILPRKEPYSIVYEDSMVYVVKPKERKGHAYRLVGVPKRHEKDPPALVKFCVERALIKTALVTFRDTAFGLSYMTKGRFTDHWHVCVFDDKFTDEEKALFRETDWRWIVRSHKPDEFNERLEKEVS